MKKYRCSKCGEIVERESDKNWIKSYCDKKGILTRIYLLI